MRFREIFTVCSNNLTKCKYNLLCGQNTILLNAKAGGIYSYLWPLKSLTISVVSDASYIWCNHRLRICPTGNLKMRAKSYFHTKCKQMVTVLLIWVIFSTGAEGMRYGNSSKLRLFPAERWRASMPLANRNACWEYATLKIIVVKSPKAK